MKTYEMIAKAEIDGQLYKREEMFYSSEKGFHDKEGNVWGAYAFDGFRENNKRDLHAFVMMEDWEVINVKRVTMDDIEKLYGCKIEIID